MNIFKQTKNSQSSKSEKSKKDEGVEEAFEVSSSDSIASTSGGLFDRLVTSATTSAIPNLNPALASVTTTSEHVQRVIPVIEQMAENVSGAASNISELSNSLLQLSNALTDIVKSVPKLADYAYLVTELVDLLYNFMLAWCKKIFAMVPSLVMRILRLFGVPQELCVKAIALVVRLISSIESKQTNNVSYDGDNVHILDQQADGLSFLLQTGPLIASNLLGFIFMRREPTLNEVRYVNDCMRLKQNIMTEVRNNTDFIMSFLRQLPDQMTLWLQFVMPMRFWLDIFQPGSEFYQWIDAVDELHSHAIRERAAYDLALQDRIRFLYDQGKKLIQICANVGPKLSSVSHLLSQSIKKIETLYDLVDVSALTRTARDVPFVVYLCGEPGQGKSYLATAIPPILANCRADEPNLSYSRNPGIQYWDGYTGNFAVQYDDFAAVRQANVAPGENAELMAIVSNEQYRIPMAHLENKGAVFRSQVVVITSNQSHPRPVEIAAHEALWRRRHALYNVAVRPEFRMNGQAQVDPDLIPADCSHWVIRRRHALDERIWYEEMTYEQFVIDLKHRYAEHKRLQQIGNANMRRMVENALNVQDEFVDAQEIPVLEQQGELGDMLIAASRPFIAAKRSPAARIWSEIQVMAAAEEIPTWAETLWSWRGTIIAVTGLICAAYFFRRSAKMEKKMLQESFQTEFAKTRMPNPLQHGLADALGPFEEIVSENDKQRIVAKVERKYQAMFPEGAYANARTGGNRAVIPRVTMRMEGCIDENSWNIATHAVIPNIARVKVGCTSTLGFVIKGRVLLVPYHLFFLGDVKVEPGTGMRILMEGVQFDNIFEEKRLIRIGKDVALYELDYNHRTYRDITTHFITENDLNFKTRYEGFLAGLTGENMPIVVTLKDGITGNKQRTGYVTRALFDGNLSANDESKIMEEFTGWSYNTITYEGMCGAPLFIMDKRMARKIVGIHVAGSQNGTSLAACVTQEMILRGLRFFQAQIGPLPKPVDVIGDMDLGLLNLEGNFSFVGTLPKKIFQNEKTKIRPSILYEKVYPVRTFPSVLTPRDERLVIKGSPLKRGVEKYARPACVFDPDLMQRAVLHVSKVFAAWDFVYDKRVFTEKEAINGVPVDFGDPINMQTSAGYPYNQRNKLPGVIGKMALFSGLLEDRSLEICDAELRRNVDFRWEEALKGNRVPSLWCDTLKDERRPLSKIEAGKTRVFTIAPLDFTIIARRLCLSFNIHFYANRLRFFSAVGINPESMEWTQLMKRLLDNSNIGFAGDYSGWDGNISPQVIRYACDIVNAWYDDEYALARSVVFEEIMHTPQVALNEIYYTHVGNPSGNPFTSILNTIVNALYIRYAWLILAPEDFSDLVCFDQNVVDFIYGDDNILSVKSEVLPFFSPENFSLVLKDLHMEYTGTDKNSNAEVKDLTSLTFLKRGFRLDDYGFYRPLMEIITITELVNWVRESDLNTPIDMCVDNCNESLSFMYFYGKQNFEKHYKKICSSLGNKEILRLHDYEYFDKRFLKSCRGTGNESMKPVGLWGTRQFTPYFDENKCVPALNELTEGESVYFPEDRQGFTQTGVGLPAMNMENEQKYKLGVDFDNVVVLDMQANMEDARSIINTKGIISLAQRATEETANGLDKPTTQDRLKRTAITDPPWTLNDMTERRVWFNTFDWNITQAVGTTLTMLETPTDVIVNYMQSAPFERFLYWNGSVRFHLRLNGMRQQQGRLQAYFVPYTRKEVVEKWHKINFAAAWGCSPVFLDPATNPEAIVEAPFFNQKNFISINGNFNPYEDFTGTFVIQVLSGLKSAESAPPNISVTLWIEFCKQEFHVPLHSAAVSRRLYNSEHAKMYDSIKKYQGVKILDQQGNTVSSATNIYGSVDHSTIPTDMRGDDFSGAASGNKIALPLDKPARTFNPLNFIRKAFQNISNTNGSEMLQRLDLNPSNMSLCLREHFSTDQDEMLYSFLYHTPTYARTVTWLATATPGTAIMGGFIGPMCSMFQDSSESQIILNASTTRVPLTQWEYNAMRYGFWTGGMKIRFDVICTQFHTGRLVLSLNYGASPQSEVGLRDATSQYAIEFELSNEKHSFEFDMPYIASTPVKRMCRGPKEPSWDVNPAFWYQNYFVGSWSVRVVTQLRTVSNSPADVDIVVSYCGSQDFETYMPSAVNNTLQGTGVYVITADLPILDQQSKNESQDGAAGGEDAAEVLTVNDSAGVAAMPIVPSGHGPLQGRGIQFGRNAYVRRVQDLIRRYVAIATPTNFNSNPLTHSPTDQKVLPYMDWLTNSSSISGFIPLNINNQPVDETHPMTMQFLMFMFEPVYPHAVTNVSPTAAPAAGSYEFVNSTSPLVHHSLQYRFWRGSLRYKVIFNAPYVFDTGGTIISTGAGAVTHLPWDIGHNIGTKGNHAIQALIQSAGVQNIGFNKGNTGNYGSYSTPQLASDVGLNYSAPYCEIEVPFASRFNVLTTEYGSVSATNNDDLRMAGYILITQPISILVTESQYAMLKTKGISNPFTVLQAAGDDFRFGTYLGVPNVCADSATARPDASVYPPTLGFSTWPDTWVVTVTTPFVPAVMTKSTIMKKIKKTLPDEEYEILDQQSSYDPPEEFSSGGTPGELRVENVLKGSRKEIFKLRAPTALGSELWRRYKIGTTAHLAHSIYRFLLSQESKRSMEEVIKDLKEMFGFYAAYERVSDAYVHYNWRFHVPIDKQVLSIRSDGVAKLIKIMENDYLDFAELERRVLEDVFLTAYSTFMQTICENVKEELLGSEEPKSMVGTAIGEDVVLLDQQGGVVKQKEPVMEEIRYVFFDVWGKLSYSYTAKSAVMEIEQRISRTKVDMNVGEFGPPHAPLFRAKVTLTIDNKDIPVLCAIGEDSTKKLATVGACLLVLKALKVAIQPCTSTKSEGAAMIIDEQVVPEANDALDKQQKILHEFIKDFDADLKQAALKIISAVVQNEELVPTEKWQEMFEEFDSRISIDETTNMVLGMRVITITFLSIVSYRDMDFKLAFLPPKNEEEEKVQLDVALRNAFYGFLETIRSDAGPGFKGQMGITKNIL